MKKRIMIFTPAAFPAVKYGGPILSVFRNAVNFSQLGNTVEIITTTLGQNFKETQVSRVDSNFSITYLKVRSNFKCSIPYLLAIPKKIQDCDEVILEDFYWVATPIVLIWVSISKKRCFIVPRGSIMQPCIDMASTAKKKIFVKLIGIIFKILRLDPIFIFSSDFERESSPFFMNYRSLIIPNRGEPKASDQTVGSPGKSGTVMLFVGRIASEKNLISTLLVYKKVREYFPNLRLKVVGPDYGELKNLRKFCVLNEITDVDFVGQQSGEELEASYRDADIFILTSNFESYGNVILEALCHGCPVVTNQNNPWKDLNEFGAGAQVPHDVEMMAAAAIEILTNGKTHYATPIANLLGKCGDDNINGLWNEAFHEKKH